MSIDAAKPNLQIENKKLFITKTTESVSAIDFSADVFMDDGKKITAIELKSVRPNSGEMRGEKQKILEGKAALSNNFPKKAVEFYIGFPFDPTSGSSKTGYNKTRFLKSIINMNKYFDPDEVLLASELWDFLSDDRNTMEQILDIINTIATTEFLDKYKFINDENSRSQNIKLFKDRLKEWNLFSEFELVDNENKIKNIIKNDKKLIKKFNQLIFLDGDYNYERYKILNELI